jgi:hypothetical protein
VNRPRAVIIGAGALGLGFLAERLCGDYDLCLADVSARIDMLRRIEADQAFVVNLCSLHDIRSRCVSGRFEVAFTDAPDGRSVLNRALADADLILTATSRSVLERVVPVISPALNARRNRAWLLFCENGLDIARVYRPHFGEHVVLVDTVMSRMCRFGDPHAGRYQPLCADCAECLIAEDYGFLPLDAEACRGGPFSAAFSMVPHAEFQLWEDVKLYLHNGMHAFIAYRNYVNDVERFADTPAWIRDEARSVMLDEVIPAIVHTHDCAHLEQIEHYGMQLLERFCNPYFDDTVDRGVRGVADKLAPDERLVGGCEYIRRAGIEPRGYATTIDAGRQILARQSQRARITSHD